MNSLEKAQALIADKNISLKDLANKCKHSSYTTLRYDRVNLEKLEDASYKRIHELAKIYDEKKLLIKSNFLVSSSESMDIADNDTPSKSTASHRKSTNSTLENKSDNALLIYSLCMAGLVIVELTAITVFVALLR